MDDTAIVKSENNVPANAIQTVETSLADFTAHNFDVIDEEFQFQRDLENEVRNRLSLSVEAGGFKNSELIALINANTISLNDRLSKSTGPISQLLVAKQQAEIAAKTAETKAAITINNGTGANYRTANETMPQDVILGAQSLNALLTALNDINKKNYIVSEDKTNLAKDIDTNETSSQQ